MVHFNYQILCCTCCENSEYDSGQCMFPEGASDTLSDYTQSDRVYTVASDYAVSHSRKWRHANRH